MFEIQSEDTAQLKRIAAAGAGGIILGFVLILLNVVVPLIGEGYDVGNAVFALFGVFVVTVAAHPTYHAATELDES